MYSCSLFGTVWNDWWLGRRKEIAICSFFVQKVGWMDGWIDGWMDGWVEGRKVKPG